MRENLCLAVLYNSVHLNRQRQAVLVKFGLGSPGAKQVTDALLKTKSLKPEASSLRLIGVCSFSKA